MKKNFTQLISGITRSKKLVVALSSLMILAASMYLYAAVGVTVTGGGTFPISADLAANATLSTPGYTSVGAITIREEANNDFATSGNIVLRAPTGWRFRRSGVTIDARLYLDNGTTNIAVGTASYSADGSTITFSLTVNNTNKRDEIIVSGVEVQALNGANVPGTGNIRIEVSNGAVVSGLSATLTGSLSQTHGSARKIAFITQPTTAVTGAAITPAPRVAIQDQFGNTVLGSNATISLSIANNPAGSNGSLTPTTPSITSVNGVATFSGISINNAGQGYTLSASSNSFTPVISTAFNITNRQPTITSLSKTCSSVGDGAFDLTVTGTDFAQGAKLRVTYTATNTSVEIDPTSINAAKTQMVVPISSSVFSTSGAYTIRVVNKAANQTDVVSTPVSYTVYSLLAVNDVSGPELLCAGTNATYSAPAGFSSYSWSLPAGAGTFVSGQNSQTANVNFAASVSGDVIVTLSATNGCGKVSTSSLIVTVKPKPVLETTASKPEICIGETVTLSVSGADSYVWSGAGIAAGTTGESLVVSPTATTTYTVIGTTNDCVSEVKAVTVTVNPLPVVSITTNLAAEYCSSDPAIALAGSPSGAGGSFRILKNGAEVATGASFNPATLGAGTYIVEYSYTDGNACTNTALKTVVVKQQPIVTLTSDLEICVGESATLTASGADSYIWSPAAGLSSTTGASVTASPTVTTTYTVIGTTDECQSVAKTVKVTVNPLPNVDIIVRGPSVFCPENYVDLVAVNNSAYTYQWFRLNDNGSSTAVASTAGKPNEYQATTTGNYYVKITTDKGCTLTSETVSVKVANVPTKATIGITGSTTFCEGGSVKFSANQSPTSEPYTYQWQVSTTTTDDGAFSSIDGEVASTYTANSPGFYRVLVSNTAESSEEVEKCTKISDPVEVTVLPQPIASITSPDQSVCQDEDGVTTFTVTGTYSGGSATWSRTNSMFTISGRNDVIDTETGITTSTVTVTFSGTANINRNTAITLVASNPVASCASASSSIVLSVKSLPKAVILTNNPTTFCQGGSATLSASVNGGETYLWSTGETTRLITVRESGSYTLTVTNGNNCSVTSEPMVVTVNELPIVTIDTELNAKYCKSESAVALAGSPVGGAFSILKGTTVISTNATQFDPEALESGTYTIEYSYTDGNTCTNKALKQVVVNALPTVSIVQPSLSSYCTSQGAIELAGNQVGGTFTINGQTAASFDPAVLGEGTHTIVYTYTDGNGCSNTTTKTVTVNPLPTASITQTGPTTFCQGGSLLLTGNSDTGTSFAWYRNGTQVATGATYSATSTGSYTVRATNSNSCVSVMSPAVQVTVNPTIVGNSISGTQTVCSGGTIAPLGQTSGTSLSGGATPYSYQWEQRIGTSGAWTVISGATAASYTPPVHTVTSSVTTYYRRIVSGGECSSTSTQTVSVTVNPLPTKPTITNLANTYYTGDAAVTMAATPSNSTGSFTVRNSGGETVSTSSIFTPCTLGAGTYTVTYTYTSGGCSNTSDPVTVRVIESTYKAVVTSSMKPFCRGDNVTHTVRVWRDATVIYPYLTNAAGDPVRADGVTPVGPQEQPVANPAFEFPANTPDVIKQYAWRYFNPIVRGGTEVTSGVTYQWTKNQEPEIGADGKTFSNAGLSSLDYYAAYVTVGGGICGPNFSERISSRAYTAEQANYNITLSATPNPVCQGQPVTFTATLDGNFPFWSTSNLELNWIVNGVVMNTTAYTGDNAALQWTASNLKDGDVVSIDFNTDIEEFDKTSKCQGRSNSNEITMRVNDIIAATATPKTPSVCLNGSETFSVDVTSTGVNVVSYVWTVGAAPNAQTYTTTTPSLTIGSQVTATPGTYPVSVVVSNICETIPLQLGSLTVKPAISPFAVAGGGSYCAGTPVSYPITLSGSETGVTYTLLRGTTVVQTLAGTGGPLNFAATSTLGDYTVSAAYTETAACAANMTGTVAITETPLPLAERTFDNASYCSLTSSGAEVILQNPESGVTYELFNGSESLGTFSGTGGTLSIGSVPAGTYTIQGVNSATGCTTPSVGSVTVTDTRITDAAGNIMYEWAGANKWKLTAMSEEVLGVDIPEDAIYTWLVKEPEAADFRVYPGITQSIIVENLPAGTEIKAEVELIVNNCQLVVFVPGEIVPLPVELLYFNATKRGNNAVLDWATASEQDNKGFEVQVSSDAKNFRVLGFVESRVGTSSLKQVYSFVDEENGKYGTRYYRLKQIDLDGKFEYFSIKAVQFGEVSMNKVKAYPNPFHSEVELSIDAELEGELQITVTTATGQQLLQRTVQVSRGTNTEKLVLDPKLPRGVYIISTRMGDFNSHFKLLKQ